MKAEWTLWAAVAAVVLYTAKKLLDKVLDELGDRLAKWLIPEGRPATYRVARLIAGCCFRIAPPDSPARAGADSLLREIDELQRTARRRRGPVAMSRSLVVPCVSARLGSLAESFLDGLQGYAFVLWFATAAAVGGNIGGQRVPAVLRLLWAGVAGVVFYGCGLGVGLVAQGRLLAGVASLVVAAPSAALVVFMLLSIGKWIVGDRLRHHRKPLG